MSGHKRATISLDVVEYRRLHDAAQKAAFLDEDSQRRLQEIRSESARLVERAVQESQQRAAAYQSLVDSLEGQVRTLETEQIRFAAQQTEALQSHLSTLEADFDRRLLTLLDEQQRALDARLSQEDARRQAWESQVEQAFAAQEQRAADRWRTASDWINACSALAEFTFEEIGGETRWHAAFDDLVGSLQNAIDNYESDFLEAALLEAQQTYRGFSALRLRVQTHALRTQTLRAVAEAQIKEAQVLLEESRQAEALDAQGNPTGMTLDVNAWTQGALDRLAEQLADLLHNLSGMEAEALEDLTRQRLPGLQEQIHEAVYQARLAALQSQMRINIADLMLQALRQQGYVLQESFYEQNDMQRGFEARVLNLEGSQVVIQVQPNPADRASHEIHIHSLDSAIRSRHELRQRALEISRSLRRMGLNVGALTTQPEVLPHQPSPSIPLRLRERLWQTP